MIEKQENSAGVQINSTTSQCSKIRKKVQFQKISKALFVISQMNDLVYVNIGHTLGENKVAQNEKI